MDRYAARIGSAFALVCCVALSAAPARAQTGIYTFLGRSIAFKRISDRTGGRAIAIDDPGLAGLLNQLGATVTWQRGERYVLVTTAQPVIISFELGSTSYDVGPVTQSASFAPFMLDGRAYVPMRDLLEALGLDIKNEGTRNVLQPELTAIRLHSEGTGTKLVAHGGIPLDARILSQSGDRLVVAFEGVGSLLPPVRHFDTGPVRAMTVRTTGPVTNPRTLVTLVLEPGTTHSAIGTDDQRDVTIGLNGVPAGQPIADQPAQAATAPPSPSAAAPSSPGALAPAPVQVTGVTTQAGPNSFSVRIDVAGNAQYAWHRLRPPDNRFWIDIENARLEVPGSNQPGSDPVAFVRAHQESPSTVRIALSLVAYDTVQVVPDASGVTITVLDQPAEVGLVPNSGQGSIGAVVASATAPVSPPGWKFGPSASPAGTYVPANPNLIVIDPGHGGSDAGAVRDGIMEKTITLDIGLRLRDILVARGWQVVMTRTTDRDVYAPDDSAAQELQARDDIANSRGARLFVSIHVNSFINAGPHGATTYYYKPSDLPLAQAIDRSIASEMSLTNDGVVKDQFYVIHHAEMPATLVETAYLSNPDDRKLLQSPQWRQQMAQAIADGIQAYAGTPAPTSTPGGP